MTERLYLNDSYLTTIHAIVVACEENDGRYVAELNRTVFYPTGGGQPHDTGSLGGGAVTDVFERSERVLHVVSMPFKPGERVECRVDWGRRFDHMQQHSGEHILSFAAKELFGTANVGFHMADRYCTIDLDMPLQREQIEEVEARANSLVCENLPVCLKYVEAEELETLALRKRANGLEGTVRIVYMPDGDSCTCCGTHVARTGEIGMIAVTAAEPHKGGVRLGFACGLRALIYLQKVRGVLDDVARAYSCRAEDVPNSVQALQRELSGVKRESKALQTRLVRAVSRELAEAARSVNGRRLIVRLVDLPASQLRGLASALCEPGSTLALLLTRGEEAAQYVLCCSNGLGLDMGELAQPVNLALRAQGGGRGCLAQGSASHVSGLEGGVEQLSAYMEQRLKALGRLPEQRL